MKVQISFYPNFSVELPDDVELKDFHDLLTQKIVEKIQARQPPNRWPGGVHGLDGDSKFLNWVDTTIEQHNLLKR